MTTQEKLDQANAALDEARAVHHKAFIAAREAYEVFHAAEMAENAADQVKIEAEKKALRLWRKYQKEQGLRV